VSAIIDVARQLDMRVAAVDVNSPEEAELLAKVGCLIGQGDYWSERISTTQLLEFAAKMNKGAAPPVLDC